MFDSMNIKKEIVDSLNAMGFKEPTEVQKQAIPPGLEGRDVIVKSKTGSGKTAAFLIPIINNLKKSHYPSAMVIVPTRELAMQVTDVAKQIGHNIGIRTFTVYGGASINIQIEAIRAGVNIIVGTPGRVIDLIKRGELPTDQIKFLVLDEFDIMLDMGFIDDVKYILSKIPQEKQTMFFSATIPSEIRAVTNKYTKNPIIINIDSKEVTVDTIEHYYSIARVADKFLTLLAYIDTKKPKKSIVFCRTQINAERIHTILRKVGIPAVLMHGGLSQSRREHSLSLFKSGTEMLIATNVASRGLDIDNVSDIINFDAEEDPKAYVHRVGRTARMGKSGRAFTILTPRERYLVYDIESYAKIKMNLLEFDLSSYKEKMKGISEQTNDFGDMAMRRNSGFGGDRRNSDKRPFNRRFGNNGNRNFHHSKRREFGNKYSNQD
ncbi:MAG: DEAD/DEAH box helicase domain protein [Candidatus Parvarchaeum acidophilus ARMAN-5]|jgi:ATP-dependent RNA helicase DeaD|uniref:DEAD/DEAH box helicase domain protein n=1 Tax=Candidatus Parvarchaeum acidophilus ARMAN-5 TaxID=662762 RepID=D6GWL2_PARA5|nr:MAG: DEAD/DEAH box helicase domain protein [Candidatus Parvarchaeum acidophilus ARMAN-5]